MPVGAVMMGGFFFLMIHFLHLRNLHQIAIFCGVFAIGILVNYIVAKRALSRLKALPTPVTRPGAEAVRSQGADGLVSGGASAVGEPEAAIEPTAEDKALLRTSRPREIRMATRGKLSVAATALVAVIFGTALGAHLYGEWARTT